MLRSTTNNQKGNAIILLFVLLFSVAVISFFTLQLGTSPTQKFDSEVAHSKNIESDIANLRSDMLVATDGGKQATSLTMGIQQPNAVGKLSLNNYSNVPSSTFTIMNAQRAKQHKAYWNGTNHTYPTKFLSYSVDYSQYTTNPSLYIEPSYIYYSQQPQPSNTKISNQPQQVVQDNQIKLTTLSGNLNLASSKEETVTVTPVSASTETIIINAVNASNPVKVKFPTRVNESRWESLLQNQLVSNGGHITNIETVATGTDGPQRVIELTFETGEQYELSMSKLHLSAQKNSNTIHNTQPEYVDWIGNQQLNLEQKRWETIDVTARDRYNNPVPGTKIWGIANESIQGQPTLAFKLQEVTSTSLDQCEGDFRQATSICTSSGGTTFSQPGVRTTGSQGTETFIYRPSTTKLGGRFIYADNPGVNQITTHNTQFVVNGSIAGDKFNSLTIDYVSGEASTESVIGGGRSSTNTVPPSFERFGLDTNNDGIIDIDLMDNVQSVSETDSYTQLDVSLDGNQRIGLNDKLLFSYGGIKNPSTPGNYTVNMTVNGEKTYSGILRITPDRTPGTLGLCGSPQNDNAGLTPNGPYNHRAVDVSGTTQDVYSAIKFQIINQRQKHIQQVNSVCIATSSDDATGIRWDSTRQPGQYGSMIWFQGRNSNGYVEGPPNPLALGNSTQFDHNGNFGGQGSTHIFKSFQFVNTTTGQPVDMRGETIQFKIVYQQTPDKKTDVMQFTVDGSEDNNT